MSDPTFGARLHAAMADRGPLCVGIDPHPGLLEAWGLPDSPAGLETFALTVAESLADRVAAIKPQSAFFERHGSRGVAVLERTLATIHEAGGISVLDVKRGDIGSTAQAYADAYLDPRSPLAADAITASPYLGFGSVDPMLDTARKHGKGVFVLALTSNPEAPPLQHARTSGGRSVAGEVLHQLARHNHGASPLGSFGAVVGATIGERGEGEDLAIGGPLLVPGIGAQGGTADDVRRIFAGCLDLVLPSTSREVLRAGPDREALRTAAARAGEQLAVLRGGATR
ncbi:MAG: orotidine-5-phosphate decarboxylase [Marmoricola sp.]|nr:orotidine-5-phosphate decarboxylase [Marmoricola sp.]